MANRPPSDVAGSLPARPVHWRFNRERFLLNLSTAGLFAFGLIFLWALRDYRAFIRYLDQLRHLAPGTPGLNSTAGLGQATEVYYWGRTLLGVSLLTGVAVGVSLLALVIRYRIERHLTEESIIEAFYALAVTLEKRDGGTRRHSSKVRTLSIDLGRALGLAPSQLAQLALGAELHDLGKIAVPDRVLHKPTALDEEEWRLMKTHAEAGATILARLRRFPVAAAIVRHHHERFDGFGYPDGLSGLEIPLGARIVSVVDAYLAMTQNRPYRRALPSSEALATIEQGAGAQFDPHIVESFVRLVRSGRSSMRSA